MLGTRGWLRQTALKVPTSGQWPSRQMPGQPTQHEIRSGRHPRERMVPSLGGRGEAEEGFPEEAALQF